MTDYINAEYFSTDETKIILSGKFYIRTSDKEQFKTDMQDVINKHRIGYSLDTINLCFGVDNELKSTVGIYFKRAMKHTCDVRGCTKPCKKEYMVGSMFGREYFCKEHYDEIRSTFKNNGD